MNKPVATPGMIEIAQRLQLGVLTRQAYKVCRHDGTGESDFTIASCSLSQKYKAYVLEVVLYPVTAEDLDRVCGNLDHNSESPEWLALLAEYRFEIDEYEVGRHWTGSEAVPGLLKLRMVEGNQYKDTLI